MICTPERPCMESECPECEGLRFFSGAINGIALSILLMGVVVAFGWFSYTVFLFWRASNGHF